MLVGQLCDGSITPLLFAQNTEKNIDRNARKVSMGKVKKLFGNSVKKPQRKVVCRKKQSNVQDAKPRRAVPLKE